MINCFAGDKITSITIDFRHIVQEDAATILSYASPYNVQLELIEPNGMISNVLSQNASQQTLSHPLYRSSSQEDLNTIERNARKKLHTNDDSSYPTLKMDQQKQQNPIVPVSQLPQAHEEHEKKNSLKKIQSYFIDMVEEKFQTKSHDSHDGKSKSGMKFGIRVLPPSGKESGKTLNKIQTDNNDSSSNMERIDIIEHINEKTTSQPPEAMKRSKHKANKKPIDNNNDGKSQFERQASINSSGIKRDAAGIPQEMPIEHVTMQAAMTALNNRKMNSTDRIKSKGKTI